VLTVTTKIFNNRKSGVVTVYRIEFHSVCDSEIAKYIQTILSFVLCKWFCNFDNI